MSNTHTINSINRQVVLSLAAKRCYIIRFSLAQCLCLMFVTYLSPGVCHLQVWTVVGMVICFLLWFLPFKSAADNFENKLIKTRIISINESFIIKKNLKPLGNLLMINFSFCHNPFKSCLLQRCESLCIHKHCSNDINPWALLCDVGLANQHWLVFPRHCSPAWYSKLVPNVEHSYMKMGRNSGFVGHASTNQI